MSENKEKNICGAGHDGAQDVSPEMDRFYGDENCTNMNNEPSPESLGDQKQK